MRTSHTAMKAKRIMRMRVLSMLPTVRTARGAAQRQAAPPPSKFKPIR